MVMFTDKSGKLETGLSSCEGKGGECKPKKPGCPEGTLPATLFDCPPDKPNTICCLGNKKWGVLVPICGGLLSGQ